MAQAYRHWKKRVMLFLTSQCITLLGSQIVQMAVVWYVTLHTNSGAWIAAFSLCSYLPQFFISFIGGVWADRCNGKLLIIGADALIAAVTLAMALLMPRVGSEPALLTALLVMSLIRSAGAGVQNPAVNALIPRLAPAEQLMRCNGINAAMQSVVQFAAPAAAAAVLTVSTLHSALLIDIITACVGIAVFSCIRLPKQERGRGGASILSDAGLGLRYACACGAVRNALAIYGLFIFFTVPAGYLSGLLVSRVFGDTYWHLTAVELAGFGGMMLGGLMMSLWGGFKIRRHTLAAGLSLFGAMAAAMGLSRRFAPYLALMAFYGIALSAVQTAITTMLQERTEAAMQGRIFGLMSSIYAACYPLGMALFGPLADALPLRGIMILSGAALIALAGAAYRSKDL